MRRCLPLALGVTMLFLAQIAAAQDWNLQIVDDAGNTGFQSKVEVASDGTPYLFYTNASDGWAYLAWWVPGTGDTGGWERIRAGYTSYDRALAMAIDGDDQVHVVYSYSNYVNYRLFDHATSSWVIDAEQAVGEGADCDMVVIDDGGSYLPVLGLCTRSTDRLKVARRDIAGVWTVETVYDDHAVNNTPSITADSSNNLHISYQEYADRDLMYATNASGNWVSEYVDVADYVGSYSSIVMDAGDVPYIVYYDSTNGNLKYATIVP